jgi:hypothetical protein
MNSNRKNTLLAKKSFNPSWDKRNSEEMKQIEDILNTYESQRDNEDRITILLKSLQDLNLIANFESEFCTKCKTGCSFVGKFTVKNLYVSCSCEMVSMNVTENSFFHVGSGSFVNKLIRIKGFMNYETGYSLQQRYGISPKHTTTYFNRISDRLRWFVDNQWKIQCTATLSDESKSKKEFMVDRISISYDSHEGTVSHIVAGIIENVSQSVFFRVLSEDDEEYFQWIKEIVPKNYYNKLTFLSSTYTERKSIEKNFIGAYIRTNPNYSAVDSTAESTEWGLPSMFYVIQEFFEQLFSGKSRQNLERILDNLSFRINGWNSFFEFLKFGNERKYRQSLVSSEEMDVDSDSSSEQVLPSPRKKAKLTSSSLLPLSPPLSSVEKARLQFFLDKPQVRNRLYFCIFYRIH